MPALRGNPPTEAAARQPIAVDRGCLGVEAILLVLAVACLIYPVVSNNIPPLLDYAGHISRVYVLYDLIHGTGFGDMYRIHFAVVPNLAVDGIVLGLMELGLSVEVAGRAFLILTLFALAAGVVALHHAIFRRYSVWPIIALPFIYQEIFFWGFINYLFGVGVALCTAALWRMNAERRLAVTGLLLFLCSVALFFCHLLALLLVESSPGRLDPSAAARWLWAREAR